MELIFDHIGITTEAKKGEESWVENTRVWVTSPKDHPFGVELMEYLRDDGDWFPKQHGGGEK